MTEGVQGTRQRRASQPTSRRGDPNKDIRGGTLGKLPSTARAILKAPASTSLQRARPWRQECPAGGLGPRRHRPSAGLCYWRPGAAAVCQRARQSAPPQVRASLTCSLFFPEEFPVPICRELDSATPEFRALAGGILDAGRLITGPKNMLFPVLSLQNRESLGRSTLLVSGC